MGFGVPTATHGIWDVELMMVVIFVMEVMMVGGTRGMIRKTEHVSKLRSRLIGLTGLKKGFEGIKQNF